MKNIQKKIGKLQTAVLVRTVVPILLMGIIIVFHASSRYEKMLYEQMQPMLASVAGSVITIYEELYEGDYVLVGDEMVSLYKGEQELTGHHELLDRIKEDAGVELTLFYKDTRILTTLKDSEGARYVATGVNGAIYHDMENAPQISFYNVTIDGKNYYVCYAPILSSDGTLSGMVGVAKDSEQILEAVRKALEPIWMITVLCVLVAAFVSVRYTQGLMNGIHMIREFLEHMTQGELNYPMNPDLIKRKDEIGDTGRSVVSMQKAVRVLVERDPLTSLYNRRYGTAKLKRIQRESETSGMPFVLAIGDIDFFKKVNDTYGHEAGDLVLTSVAKQLKKCTVGRGFVSRWGGEEFLLVLEHCDKEKGREVIRTLMQDINGMKIAYQDVTIRVTMTFGLVEGNLSEDYEELIRLADARLYYGKEHGRNRLISGAEEMLETSLKEGNTAEASGKLSVQDTLTITKEVERQLSEEEKAARDQLRQNQMVEEIVRKMAEHLIMEEEMEKEKLPEQEAMEDKNKKESEKQKDGTEQE